MGVKLKRNTESARAAALANGVRKREELQNKVRRIMRTSCKQRPRCSIKCDAQPFSQCMKPSKLAKELNASGVKSLRGKVGKWQSSMVSNLFRGTEGKLKAD